MTTDLLQKWATLAQTVAVTLAVCIGGGWTYWTFGSLYSVEKAKQELEKTRQEVDQLSRKRALLDLDVKVEAIHSQIASAKKSNQKRQAWFVHAVVAIRNHGANQAVIDIANDSIFLKKLHSAADAAASSPEGIASSRPTGVSFAVRSLVVLPGVSEELHYVLEVPTPGLYEVEFRVPVDKSALDQYKADAVDRNGTPLPESAGSRQYGWSATAVINVPSR